MTARENKINLNRRRDELLEELNELKEGGQPDSQLNIGLGGDNGNGIVALKQSNNSHNGSPNKNAKEDPNYFENSVKKMKDYIAHLQKRNDAERKNAL